MKTLLNKTRSILCTCFITEKEQEKFQSMRFSFGFFFVFVFHRANVSTYVVSEKYTYTHTI